ncbi:MAG: alpha-hydroxy acid oxidase, partial [Pseudomonadota bacterium]
MRWSTNRVHSSEDARQLAQRNLPRLVFDFIQGGAGRETGLERNTRRFDELLLQPRVMADVATRDLGVSLLGQAYKAPFGIAPMGMCNLVDPGADRAIASVGAEGALPVCLSAAASTPLERMRSWAGEYTWFQVYFGGSAEATLKTIERARAAGYTTLVLTVDVPQVSRRVRDLRNGFSFPFHMSPRAALDFATHPRWSIRTLLAGLPSPQNISSDSASASFDRNASRAGADWAFLARARDRWPGHLIVKGVTAPDDAIKVMQAGADAIYVSNHGARQLDSVPAAIDLLPLIRHAVGPHFTLLFDSGVRNGELRAASASPRRSAGPCPAESPHPSCRPRGA